MAVPFRRTSKTKKRMRRTHLKKSTPTLTKCPKCGESLQPHRVCIKCGYYKGKEVLIKEVPEEEQETKKEKNKKEKKK